jgi:hypothetical protein
MTGGLAPRCKGDRIEPILVRFLQTHDLGAQKVPLSGAAGGRFGRAADRQEPLVVTRLTPAAEPWRANG